MHTPVVLILGLLDIFPELLVVRHDLHLLLWKLNALDEKKLLKLLASCHFACFPCISLHDLGDLEPSPVADPLEPHLIVRVLIGELLLLLLPRLDVL